MERASKGKSMGALASMAFPAEGEGDDSEEEAPSNLGASFDNASESLLQQLNVPQGRRAQVKEALKEAIHACMRGYPKEE